MKILKWLNSYYGLAILNFAIGLALLPLGFLSGNFVASIQGVAQIGLGAWCIRLAREDQS